MRAKAWLLRLFRLLMVALAAWLAFRWLEPQGLGWVVLAVAGLAVALWIGFRAVLVRRARAEEAQADRWAEALLVPEQRPAAVRELQAERALRDPKNPKHAEAHARLTLVLAELLEAEGKPDAALDALGEVALAGLSDALRAVVLHARAISHLSAGDPEAAGASLDAIGGPCGTRDVDLRVRLARGLVHVERGEREDALIVADEVRQESGDDRHLLLEARVLKAVALAEGDREAGLKTMAGIDDEMLEVLVVLGLPRVRRLADEALGQRDA